MADGFTMLLVVLLLLAVGGLFLVIFQAWVIRPRPERLLADSFKVRAPRLSRDELETHMAGQFIELGFDPETRQAVILAEEDRFAHVLNLGRSGVGKTSYFLDSFLWRDIAHTHNSVVVFDGQHDLTEPVIALCEQYGREHIVFPDAGVNPLAGTGDANDRAERFADLFAQAMEIQTGTPGDFYTQRAQIFIRKVIPLFERAYGCPMTLQELLWLAMSPDYRSRLTEDAGSCPEASDYVGMIGQVWDTADFEQNLAGLVNFLDRLQVGERKWLYNQRDALSLEQAIDQQRVIIIREGGEYQSQARTLGLIYMLALHGYVRNRAVDPTLPPVWVYADEAHMYYSAGFPTLVATARKKRVGLHLGFQNFAQFAPFTDTVTGNAATWIVHGGLLHEDAQFVADQIGQRTYHDRSISHTPTHSLEQAQHSEQVVYDYLVQPHRIRGLSHEQVIVLTIEERETQAARIIHKPPHTTLAVRSYVSADVPNHGPATIWDSRNGPSALPGPGSDPPDLPPGPPEPTNRIVPIDTRKGRKGTRKPPRGSPPASRDWE